jgi:O-antigen ligase
MNAAVLGRSGMVVGALVAASLAVGWLLPRFEPQWFIAGFLGLIAAAVVMYDYRVGVVCLTVLFPWSSSPFVPQTHGFNLVNFLVAATTVSLVLRRILRREHSVLLPRVMVWYYMVPFVLAVALAFPNLGQARANYPLEELFEPVRFLIGRGIKPFFLVIYAVLVANAIRDSKKPELFLVAFAVSTLLPCVLIIQQVLAGANVMDRSETGFLDELGLHPNSYGLLLTSCLGPLLFIAIGKGPGRARLFSGFTFAVVSIGILLTASRGAAVAYVVVVGAWLWRRRKPTDILVAAAAVVLLVLLLPDQVQERLTVGLDTIGRTDHSASSDRLTMGRGYIWEMLAPDIWLSPLWGHGLGSTAWNSATNSGRNIFGHPHNLYLGLLLDIGVLGLAAVAFMFYRLGQTLRRLSAHPSLSPVLRDFFAGAFVSLVALLVFYFTNGYWWPNPEQTFLWFTMGVAFAFWELAPRAVQHPARQGHLTGRVKRAVRPAHPSRL